MHDFRELFFHFEAEYVTKIPTCVFASKSAGESSMTNDDSSSCTAFKTAMAVTGLLIEAA